MGADMSVDNAREIAETMSYEQAVRNAIGAQCIPFKKATRIKLEELLDLVRPEDGESTLDRLINEGVRIGKEDAVHALKFLISSGYNSKECVAMFNAFVDTFCTGTAFESDDKTVYSSIEMREIT